MIGIHVTRAIEKQRAAAAANRTPLDCDLKHDTIYASRARSASARREKLKATWDKKRTEQERRQVEAVERMVFDLESADLISRVGCGLAPAVSTTSTVGRVVKDEDRVYEVVWDGVR